jgi:hypothetical protein
MRTDKGVVRNRALGLTGIAFDKHRQHLYRKLDVVVLGLVLLNGPKGVLHQNRLNISQLAYAHFDFLHTGHSLGAILGL